MLFTVSAPITAAMRALRSTTAVPRLSAPSRPLTHRIYHLIALAFRAYILSWLPRITRDRSLLPHIHQTLLVPILTPVLHGLSNEPDRLIPFLLYDLPGVLTLHCKTYWRARETLHVLQSAGEPRLDGAYHSHLPLLSAEPAGSADSRERHEHREEPRTQMAGGAKGEGQGYGGAKQSDNAAGADAKDDDDEDDADQAKSIPAEQYVVSGLWLTALADTIIKQSLPKDEYAVTVERTMMRELIGRTILGNIAKRIGEDWFWWGLLLKFLPDHPAHSAHPAHPSADKSHPSVDGHPMLDRAIGMMERLARGVVAIWTAGVWVMATYTAAAPGVTHAQTTRCWLEFAREVLNIDGRAGRRNWPLRVLWGTVELFFLLLSPLFDR